MIKLTLVGRAVATVMALGPGYGGVARRECDRLRVLNYEGLAVMTREIGEFGVSLEEAGKALRGFYQQMRGTAKSARRFKHRAGNRGRRGNRTG